MREVFSCPKGKSVIIFGGHEGWIKEMKRRIKGVRIVKEDGPNGTERLKYADEIWVQHNAISHSFYRKILAVSRERKIPLHYFAFSSHIKCVRQFVRESGKNS